MAEHHVLMGGKLHVYKRPNSGVWQCSAYFAGKNWRVSTKEESLSHAKEIAEDWYLGLRGKARNNELKSGKTFRQVADQFMKEYSILTQGQRSPLYVENQERRIKGHLMSFFGDKVVTEITPGLVQEYRIKRMTKPDSAKPKAASRDEPANAKSADAKGKKAKVAKRKREWVMPARSTIHQEIVSLRHVLKTANRHGWLPYLPDLSAPYRASGKVAHRAWFSPEEYQMLYEATRDRSLNPRHNRGRWRWESEQLHDFVLFMVNTGLRPDEAKNLEFRDVVIAKGETEKNDILEISVRGKRGVGYCKSMPGAVEPFRRLLARERPLYILTKEARRSRKIPMEPPQGSRLPVSTDRVFPNSYRELLNNILDELGLKRDREEQVRTAYSLRHTYICLRLMQGADIYQIAKNCRTSVEMIEKFYASHIKDIIDASAVNVMKPKPKAKAKSGTETETKERPDGRAPKQPANAKGAKPKRGRGHPKTRH